MTSDRFDRQRELVRLYDRSPIRRTLDIQLSFDEQGHAVARLPHSTSLENAMGGTHGGIVATLLDTAGWFAAAAAYDTWIATTDLHIQLLEPAPREALVATGELIRAGKRLATSRMLVRSEGGLWVAMGSGTFSVTSLPFAQPADT